MICQNANRADQTSLSAFKPPAIKRKIVKFVPVIRTGSCRFTWSNFCLSSAVVRRRPESLRPWWFDEQDKLLRWSVAFYLWDWSRSVLLEQNKRATKQIETWLLEKSTNEKRTKSANLGQSLLELQIEIEWNERWDHIVNFGMELGQRIGWIHRHPQISAGSDINGTLCGEGGEHSMIRTRNIDLLNFGLCWKWARRMRWTSDAFDNNECSERMIENDEA